MNPPLKRGMFDGETLFIIATGPSILAVDFEPLRYEYTWGTGHLIDWDGMPFMPTFYGVGEYSTLVDRLSGVYFGARLEEMDTCRFAVDEPAEPRARGRPWTPSLGYWHEMRGDERLVDGFFGGLDEDDLRLVGFCPECSALHSALQPAVWLGFKHIYFLGLDNTDGYVYAPKMLRRVDERPAKTQDVVRKAIRIATEHCARAGVTLKAITPEGTGSLAQVSMEEALS